MKRLQIEALSKSFTLHLREGLHLPSFQNIHLDIEAGECVAISGPSGAGKSSLFRCIYGNYLPDNGHIWWNSGANRFDITQCNAREMLSLRRWHIAWVSQFLRVIPRVPTWQLVAEVSEAQGVEARVARERAEDLLLRFGIPRNLHALPPATFSGGEQQRVNLARAFIGEHDLLLLDEPTASLDQRNTAIVLELLREAQRAGRAILVIFHDPQLIQRAADRQFSLPSGGHPS